MKSQIAAAIGTTGYLRAFVAVVLIAIVGSTIYVAGGDANADPDSTLFSPTAVNLVNVGDSASVTVSTSNLTPAVNGVQLNIAHGPEVALSNFLCSGLFAGASLAGPVIDPGGVPGSTLVSCVLIFGSAIGTGDLISFDITRVAAGTTNLSLITTPGPFSSFYADQFGTSFGVGVTNTVTVTETPPGPPTCQGHVATIVGTSGDDTIVGTSGDDVIVALEGNDSVSSLAGNDIVCAGDGADTVIGGPGSDLLYGESGPDQILGGDGDDLIEGGPGQDILLSGNGDDSVSAGGGADSVNGGSGDDLLFGNGGNDLIAGADGNDVINGGNGTDNVDGGPDSRHLYQ